MTKKIFIVCFSITLVFGLYSLVKAESTYGGTVNPGLVTGMEGVIIAAPTASPAAGTYHATQSVSLTAISSTAICYTTNGTAPVCNGTSACTTGDVYGSAISITSTKTVKSIACYADSSYGDVSSDTYTLTCSTASVSNGSVAAYPGCAITCNSGYTLSGSTCSASGGGGGGGGGGSTASVPTTQQTSITTADGTQVTTIVSSSNGTVSASATINTVASPTDSQTITLDTSAVAEVAKVEVTLSSAVMQEIVANHGADTDITVNITSQTASSNQRTNTALGNGIFLIGYDVFSIDISAGDTAITSFENPLTLSFDVSAMANQENLSIAWFDTTQNKWIDLGGTLSAGILTISVSHLTDFAVTRTSSTTDEADPAATATAREQQIANILNESTVVNDSSSNLASLLSHNGVAENTAEQTASMEKYTNNLIVDIADLTDEDIEAINNFIVYGTQTTRVLGAGERAGVVNSYKSAFNKLPTDADGWADVIKIANGRWPSETSQAAEDRANVNFRIIYLREPDMNNPNDNAAITIMAYGLRPDSRNLDSEKTAIKTFKAIFGYNPEKATAWDSVRAIAYSGATR